MTNSIWLRLGQHVGIALAAISAFGAVSPKLWASDSVVVGSVRVQMLSRSLVRLEAKGPAGFEDRKTFRVVNRNWPGTSFGSNVVSGLVVINTAQYVVYVPQGATSLAGTYVTSPTGQLLYEYTETLQNSVWLPGPSENPTVLSFADAPRLIPPAWGIAPAPPGSPLISTSGWDTSNDAPDIYVFVPNGSYKELRSDFLKLTGPTEMVPLYALGAFDSRWVDYSEETALAQIDDYRARHIPLDVLVCDTGWRQNASTGYQPNTTLFPDMPRFFSKAHEKKVRVMFNDHPEPVSDSPLSPTEVNYRGTNLAALMKQGLDVWWYDRNWGVSLLSPSPNLRKEVWGMSIYHDVARATRPQLRPLIMANVDGIDNGALNRPSDVAAHRFSIQWTGDIGPSDKYLSYAVENAVHAGVRSLYPYQSDDLGGHTSDPAPSDYIRWLEYGALSPIFRPHCTHYLSRMPWAFGPEVEWVARRYIDMRYRLLPVFYAAAHENFETGEPLLRRLDLDYPQFPEASQNNQYLISHSMLVAPVTHSDATIVPTTWFSALQGEYYNNTELTGSPVLTRSESNVELTGAPPSVQAQNFSARFQGAITVPVEAGNITLAAVSDDGVRLWVDNQLCIDNWKPNDSATTESTLVLKAGQRYQLRIEYLQLGGGALLSLKWRGGLNPHSAWIPPGNWINAWTGTLLQGPMTDVSQRPLDQMPIYIRVGSIFVLAPKMQYTGQLPWDPVTLDIYPGDSETAKATLYEDDTLTIAYKNGEFRKTAISAWANEIDRTVSVKIEPAVGHFEGALTQRAWVARLRRPANWTSSLNCMHATVNGQEAEVVRKIRNTSAMPFGAENGAPDADVFEVSVPSSSVLETNFIVATFTSEPSAWTSSDVGNLRSEGNAVEGGTVITNSTWRVCGSGGGIGGTADGFHFVRQPAVGDIQMTVCVQSQDPTQGQAKAGIMISEGLERSSRSAVIAVTPDHRRVFQYRAIGDSVSQTNMASGSPGPCWLRLARKGASFTGLASSNGVDWVQIGTTTIPGMSSNAYIGLAVTASQIYDQNYSVDDTNFSLALFKEVSLDASVSISAPNDQTTSMSTPTPLLPFKVGGSNMDALTFSAQSSNPSLLPVQNIILSGAGEDHFVRLFPVNGKSGVARVTLTVRDGNTSSSAEFALNVLPLSGLLLCERFTNYANGNLVGQPFRGLGFAGNGTWAGVNKSFSGQILDAAQVSSSGLEHAAATNLGGKATVKGDGSNLKGIPNLSNNGLFAAAGLLDTVSGTIGGGNVSGTLYVSFLFRAVATSRANEYGGLHLSRGSDSTGILFGNSWAADAYSLYDAPTDTSFDLKNDNGFGSYLIMDNNVHFMVAKITYCPGSPDKVSVWMDPGDATSETTQDATDTYSVTASADCSFDRFFLRGGNNNQFDFGEIRFGTDWRSVCPSSKAVGSSSISVKSASLDADNKFGLTFSGPAAQSYTIWATTNLALPISHWTNIGTGTFGFDTASFNDSLSFQYRFYRITSP